jgi:D-apionolactonase
MSDLQTEWSRHAQRPAPARIPLRWGLLSAEFDPAEGWLRSLRLEGREVVRAIYGAVRDRNWGTVTPRVHGVQVAQEDGAFLVRYEAECRAPGIEFRWQAEIDGDQDGVLSFRFAGVALTGFWKNRIGLCVLHPIKGCAGERCRVETVDGIVTEDTFPAFIAPHQSFRNVRAISHGAVEVRFDGEIFETEDQRNWTDASFKTYGTPLAEPFPVWIKRGTRVEQTVTVQLHNPRADFCATYGSEMAAIPELRLTEEASRRLPPVGFGMASHGQPLTPDEVARLRRLRPAHLRVDLRIGEGAWPARWRMAAVDAAALGAKLHVAVFLSDDAATELAALAGEVAAHPAPVSLWLIFHERETSTSAHWVRMAEAVLPGDAPFAAGTDANFAELNRARPDATETALPCFSMNPQVHAFDDASMIENLGAQVATVESARQFAPRPVVVSPITLRPRPQADGRQRSHFAAAWTLGSLARLAALDGIHSLTYFETTGERGLLDATDAFPMFHIFAALSEGEKILPAHSTHPLVLDGVCTIGHDGLHRWVAANLTATAQRIRIAMEGSSARVRVLGESNVIARRTPTGFLELELTPYACAQVTVED